MRYTAGVLYCRRKMESVRWAFRYGAWSPGRTEWLLATSCVQVEEKARIGQFVFTRDAKAAMAGRLLIRKLIADKLQIPWNEVLLQRTSKGKPFLVNDISRAYPSFNFNISHHGEYAVLAAEVEFQVGVDIMKTELPGSGSIQEFFRIMMRQFTEKEWKSIKCAGSECSQLDMFYRYWALKESFIKAIGVGIGFNLQRIEFHASPLQLEIGKMYKETSMLLDGDIEEGWTFEESLLDDCHHVAVALGKPHGFRQEHSEVLSAKSTNWIPTEFTVFTFDDLVASAVPLAPEDPTDWDNFNSKQEPPVRQRTNST